MEDKEIKAEKIKPYASDTRQKGDQVRDMFDNIAPAYDFMNRAMTLGIDKLWRRKAVKLIKEHALAFRGYWAEKPDYMTCYSILDEATGTGDLALLMVKKVPDAYVTGIDLSEKMVEIGRAKVKDAGLTAHINLMTGDCLNLPFPDDQFDCVTVAFGVRNFQDLAKGYREMLRVLRPGGMLCVIELSTPVSPLVRPLYNLYTRHIIPFVGRLVSKDTSAYSYLPASIEAVPQRSDMTAIITDAGFANARFIPLTFGVCTIYTAIKESFGAML